MKFADQDSYVLTALIKTAKTNQADLNVVIQDQDYLRATAVTQQQTGLTTAPATPVPNVSIVAQQTVGSSQNTGGGGAPCFIGITSVTLEHGYKYIRDVCVETDFAIAFDEVTGIREPQQITDKWEHLVDSWMLVEFEDGHSTGVDKDGDHKYWNQDGIYIPIRELDSVWHWSDGWKARRVVERRVINEKTLLYNITVANRHNYIANGDAVSNNKKLPDDV